MRRRCNNSENEDYGARGVTYDPRWDDFDVFLADMGERPPGTTLDRRDPDGHYDKSNCRWATAIQQANNKRNSVRLAVEGVERPIKEWAEIVGIKPATIYGRLYLGWSPHDAVFKPIG